MEQEKVLIVESDETLRDMFVDLLRSEGYAVETASLVGKDAEDKLKRGRWDVILLDVGLAKMDGLKVLQTYRSYIDSTASEKPPLVIAILIYEDQEPQAHAFADIVFTKTQFTPGDLVAQMKDHLHRSLQKSLEASAPRE
jgi:DNA-binding response OmpR family regulator